MKRKIYDELLKWKSEYSNKYALLIDGASQVGKSYIVSELASKMFSSYIIIDFKSADETLFDLLELYLPDLDKLFSVLSRYYKVELVEHASLIVFDGVQLFPKARDAIKRLVADGRYSYIEICSMVSFDESITEEMHITLNPMDFEEFLWATGRVELVDTIKKRYELGLPMGQSGHRLAAKAFREYMAIGGMPKAVQAFADSGDYNKVEAIKQDILARYKHDIEKHSGVYSAKARSLFEAIPVQLMKKDRKFHPSALKRNSRTRDYADAILWLDDADMINLCFNSTILNIGLRINRERLSLKAYMADTGLLFSLVNGRDSASANNSYIPFLDGKPDDIEGVLIDNSVAQILKASGYKLYFYSSYSKTDSLSRMEIDFLITRKRSGNKHSISAIEVKTGKNYTLSSINKFKVRYGELIESTYIIHENDYKAENGIIYLPAYMAALL